MRALLVLVVVCMAAPVVWAQGEVSGVVRDANGAAVAGAEVALRDAGGERRGRAGGAGEFRFENVVGEAEIRVYARGFALAVVRARAGETVEVVLRPAAREETVAVTAARAELPLEQTAGDVVVLSAGELESTAAVALDDALRQVPGFSLFRRSSSRVANPTVQGVTLRGLGASGASRALVLHDGVPLNDPFGGWVYWGRAPKLELERAEVLRGGASQLYGNAALSGVVNLVSARPADDLFVLDLSLGNQFTPQAGLLASAGRGRWRATLSGEAFETQGYVLVPEGERGLVDTRAGSRHQAAQLTVERAFGKASRGFVTGEFYGESRDNGTPLQTNRTALGQAVVGADLETRAGVFAVRAYGSGQRYNQSFSAVAAGRDSETLTRTQRVPAQQLGGSAQWTRTFGIRHLVVAGVEARVVEGSSDELVFVAGVPSRRVDAGGATGSYGVFAQETWQLHRRLTLTAGARGDFWRHTGGFARSEPLAPPAPATFASFPARDESAFSPSLALLWRPAERWAVTASGYRAFRAPTLNELYRGFRVGNVVTLANEELKAERLTGAEGGVRFASERFSAGATFFWAEINRPIANVTLAVTPGLITRQRQNLGQTHTAGLELESEARLTSELVLSAGYIFSDAVVERFDADPALAGLQVPQVPRHSFTFQARYARPRWTLAAQGRAAGRQFDDDQNLLPLDRFFALDAYASYRLLDEAEVFLAAENVLDRRWQVGRTPVVTLGPPALVRAGIRVRLARAR